VMDAALTGEPQQVTRRGKPAVVVLTVEEYKRLCQDQPDHTPNFVDHLHDIPRGTRQRRLRVAVPNQRLHRGHRSLMYLSVTAIISAVRRLIGSSVLFVE
ncbi:MAG: type II toxin-antitoxin system prevent-host-death family antitoxin, partial [Caldilineaceae bacterium SB0665_bin_21]|nr:type II toxin-antitoxin system prevent-host-death family antitoxin [Caldilineaceae bacterium SB0665_bin_21]